VSAQPGQTLSHYRLVDKIGEGGMGVVWKAFDTRLEREVAIKILPPEFASDPARLARFEREAKAIAALNHPNIVTIYSVERADGIHFFTMELVDGRPLSDQVSRDGLPFERFLELAIPLADALSSAHEHGITHRDLKPANIMVTRQGRVKILDFGLAKLVREEGGEGPDAPTRMKTLTRDGGLLGTVPYMSPEQARGQPVDARSDVFSFGSMLYEMLTGQLPFLGDSTPQTLARILEVEPEPLSDLRDDVPLELERIVHRCLRKQPERRYNDTRDLVNSLRDLEASLPTSARAQPRDGVEPRLADPRRIALANWCASQSIPGLKAEAFSQIIEYVIGQQEEAGGWPGKGDHWSEVKTACILKSLARLSFDSETRWAAGERPPGIVGGVRGSLNFLLRKLSHLSLTDGLVGEDLWDTCQVLLALATFGETEAGKQYANEINHRWDRHYRNACESEPRISWTGPSCLVAMGDVIVAYQSLLESDSRIDDVLDNLRSLEHEENGRPAGAYHAVNSDDPAKHRWNTALVLRSLAAWPSPDIEMIARASTWILDQLDHADRWLGPTDRESPMYLARCLEGLHAATPHVSPALAGRIDQALEQGNARIDEFWSPTEETRTGDLKAYSAVIEYLSGWTLRIPAGLAVGLTLPDP
jgi:serine/threonine protein kinase